MGYTSFIGLVGRSKWESSGEPCITWDLSQLLWTIHKISRESFISIMWSNGLHGELRVMIDISQLTLVWLSTGFHVSPLYKLWCNRPCCDLRVMRNFSQLSSIGVSTRFLLSDTTKTQLSNFININKSIIRIKRQLDHD